MESFILIGCFKKEKNGIYKSTTAFTTEQVYNDTLRKKSNNGFYKLNGFDMTIDGLKENPNLYITNSKIIILNISGDLPIQPIINDTSIEKEVPIINDKDKKYLNKRPIDIDLNEETKKQKTRKLCENGLKCSKLFCENIHKKPDYKYTLWCRNGKKCTKFNCDFAHNKFQKKCYYCINGICTSIQCNAGRIKCPDNCL